MYTKVLRAAIQNYMDQTHSTRQEVSKLCDVPLGTINRIFSTSINDVNTETYSKITKGLNISVDALWGISPEALPVSCKLCHESGIVKCLNDDKSRLHQDKETLYANNMALLKKYENAVDLYKEEQKTLKKERIFSRILSAIFIVLLILEFIFNQYGWIHF